MRVQGTGNSVATEASRPIRVGDEWGKRERRAEDSVETGAELERHIGLVSESKGKGGYYSTPRPH